MVLSVLSRRNNKRAALPEEAVDELLARLAPNIGKRLAEEWQLPDAVKLTVRFGDDVTLGERHRGERAAVRLARLVLPCIIDDEEPDDELLSYCDGAMAPLGLEREDVEAIIDRRQSIVETVDALPIQ